LWVVEFCDFDVEFTVEPVGEESPFDDLPMINQPW